MGKAKRNVFAKESDRERERADIPDNEEVGEGEARRGSGAPEGSQGGEGAAEEAAMEEVGGAAWLSFPGVGAGEEGSALEDGSVC